MVYETLVIMEKIISLVLQFYLIAILDLMLSINWGIVLSIFIPLSLFIAGWIAKFIYEIYQERKRLIIRAKFLKVSLEALRDLLKVQSENFTELAEKIKGHDILKVLIEKPIGLNTKFYSAELLQDIHYLLSLSSTNGHFVVQQLSEMVERLESVEKDLIYNFDKLFKYVETQEQNIIKLKEPISDYLYKINLNRYEGLKSPEIWRDIFIKHCQYQSQKNKTLPLHRQDYIVPLKDLCSRVMGQGYGGNIFEVLTHLEIIYEEIEDRQNFISDIMSDNSKSMHSSKIFCEHLIDILDISIENTSMYWPKYQEYAPLEKKITALNKPD